MPSQPITPENYHLSVLAEPTCYARTHFASLPGEIKLRTIDLHQASTQITVSQLKKDHLGTKNIFTQHISVNYDIHRAVEGFLRQFAIDIPANKDELPPKEFIEYYKTPFSLVGCTISSTTLGIVSFALDYQSSMTLRLIEARLLERKLAELELAYDYTTDIRIRQPKRHEGENDLVLHEYKMECGHILFQRGW